MDHERIDLGELRGKLAGQRGPAYWRSLGELAETPAFVEMLHREFPREASAMPDGPTRRQFLHVMAASFALAGLTGCTKEVGEEIIPYVKKPEQILPGKRM